MDETARTGPAGLLTERLRLAPVVAADEAELFALHSDPRAFAEDSTEPLTDPAQMRWVLGQWREGWARYGLGHLTVRARRDPAGDGGADLPVGLLGVVGLVPLSGGEGGKGGDGDQHPVLSAYWRLSPAATGLGIATEAMRAVLAQAHAHLAQAGAAPASMLATSPTDQPSPDVADEAQREVTGLPEIVAITAGANEPSLALAARLGFRPAPPDRPVPGGRHGDVLLLLPPSAPARLPLPSPAQSPPSAPASLD
jgi:RimJ/RimL family protein N-acetyltransferase